MKKCLNCNEEFNGRSDRIFCSPYCKSNYHYQQRKEKEDSLYVKITKQLRLNRKILKEYNKAGKSTVRKQVLIDAGFNPKIFTHYWKNSKNQVYLFCFEFGFMELKENGKSKYVLVQWQEYMNRGTHALGL